MEWVLFCSCLSWFRLIQQHRFVCAGSFNICREARLDLQQLPESQILQQNRQARGKTIIPNNSPRLEDWTNWKDSLTADGTEGRRQSKYMWGNCQCEADEPPLDYCSVLCFMLLVSVPPFSSHLTNPSISMMPCSHWLSQTFPPVICVSILPAHLCLLLRILGMC